MIWRHKVKQVSTVRQSGVKLKKNLLTNVQRSVAWKKESQIDTRIMWVLIVNHGGSPSHKFKPIVDHMYVFTEKHQHV